MKSAPQFSIIRPLTGLLSAILLTTACTTVTTQSFRVNENSQVATSFIAVDADFGKYDRLSADDMGIYFPTDAAPTVADQDRTRQIFRKAFLGELTEYRIVDNAGPTTLQVQATLIDFRNASAADVMSVRRELRDIAEPGVLLFLMELKDSESGVVLGRAADSAGAPGLSTSPDSDPTDWSAVEVAADHWASLFRQFLDENLNK